MSLRLQLEHYFIYRVATVHGLEASGCLIDVQLFSARDRQFFELVKYSVVDFLGRRQDFFGNDRPWSI